MPMLYSEGVRTGRISLDQFVALTSANAARIFGLHPRKGAIAVGSDADIALWDPWLRRTIDGARMQSLAGYSVYDGWVYDGWVYDGWVYDGWPVQGWPRFVLRRGRRDHHAGLLPGTARGGHRAAGRERHQLRGHAGQRAGLGEPRRPRHHRPGRHYPPLAAGDDHDVGRGRGPAGRHAGGVFSRVVPFLVAAGSLILLAQPRISQWQEDNQHAWGRAAVLGGLGGVSVYNGYFGAGSGILLIALLLLTAEPVLHRANAIKNVLLAASDIAPAILFAVTGKVVWTAVIPLGAGPSPAASSGRPSPAGSATASCAS